MAGPDHRRDRPLALGPLGPRLGERPEPPPPGEAKRRLDPLGLGQLAAPAGIVLADAGRVQALADPPRAIAPPAQRAGLGEREGAVVDIAEARQPLGDRFDVGFVSPRPSRARAACAGGNPSLARVVAKRPT